MPGVDPAAAQPGTGGPLLAVEGLRTAFRTGRGPVRAVDGVSFTLEDGETLGLVGESGSGKTALARSVMGLLPTVGVERSGSVRFEGRELVGAPPRALRALWGTRMAMVLQDPVASLNPVQRVGHQVAEGLRRHRRLGRAEARGAAVSLLGRVGIPAPGAAARAYPHQLSGGTCQRVAIAIALACEPRLLLADEPTTGLDVTVQAQILDLLGSLRAERRMALLLVTHDLGVVATRTDRILVLYAGRVVEQAPTRALFAAPAVPYTEALLACTPRLDAPGPATPGLAVRGLAGPGRRRLATIEGRPPDPLSPPPGCPFAPRCRYARSLCHRVAPPLVAAERPDHLFACWYPLGGRAGPAPEPAGVPA